jgi:DNA-binding transcriptional regulator YiaG
MSFDPRQHLKVLIHKADLERLRAAARARGIEAPASHAGLVRAVLADWLGGDGQPEANLTANRLAALEARVAALEARAANDTTNAAAMAEDQPPATVEANPAPSPQEDRPRAIYTARTLRAAIKRLNMPKTRLAGGMGVSEAMVRHWVAGKKPIAPERQEALRAILGEP